MSLKEYSRKRQFDRTPEPRADSPVARNQRPIFVVQLHHASRRHYDFRLQVGDTLKSWACPKGPSYDPAIKRLAVEVEDHPISYADFEGDISEGYGAGHVDTFDRGVWSTADDPETQLQKGHLRFELFGDRLKGGWHLVRSGRKEKKPAWFLMKAKDAFVSELEADDLLDANMRSSTRKAAGKSGGAKEVAESLASRKPKKAPAPRKRTGPSKKGGASTLTNARKAKFEPGFFEPQLARLKDAPPKGDHWLHEVKWDGYRILTSIDAGDVTLWSRNGKPWTEKLPDIRQAIESLHLGSAQFDGELIALKDGKPDFNALQKSLSGESLAPLVYVLFDVPYLDGYDLRRVALIERKAQLQTLLENPPPHLSYSTHTVGQGDAVFAMASDQQLEGILSKRVDSPYRAGRGDDWLKIKRLEAEEFAVVGYTATKGSRKGFGSLLLARPADQDEWEYVGRVGSGFSDQMLIDLTRAVAKAGKKQPSIKHVSGAPKDALWIPPMAVAEVWFRGIGNQGLLRQPSLKAIRVDKAPEDLRDSDRDATASRHRKPKHRASSRSLSESDITITHPDRVVFPEHGVTKQDIADYYAAVMDWFLPGVLDRPTSVIRCPHGIDSQCFFQKHLPTGGLKHAGSVRLKEGSETSAVYVFPQSADSIMELVQSNAIEFHPWGSHVDSLDLADRLVFDLDPGPDVPWKRVVAAARLVKKLLSELALESFVRTTGGKGLHVVVPLRPGSPWPELKQFAQSFATTLATVYPLEFVATSTKAIRSGKIFVDYLRNDRGATSVASYSLRARAGAPVAMPLRWSELGRIRSGAQFDIRSAPARLKRMRSDPWKDIDSIEQDLADILDV